MSRRNAPNLLQRPVSAAPARAPARNSLRLTAMLALVCGVVAATHAPSLHARAISIDDGEYVLENRLVLNPSWSNAGRFLGEVFAPSTVRGYYQPLAMISLMLDTSLGGSPENPSPYHRTSFALHVANTALIVVLLYLLTGSVSAAALCGLLFGVHPMTVEPIPWLGERKTLLASFFSLLCLIAYVQSARRNSYPLLGLSLALYVLALLSKPTSTPLPALMLILDWWPLRRLGGRALIEKLPFFAVGAISAAITYISQRDTLGTALPGQHGALHVPLTLCHNIVFYLWRIVWPVRLAPHYPIPEPMNLQNGMVLAGVIGTVLLFGALTLSLRRTRALAAGWLFFFIAILPTMGVIGFTNVIASDKFAYLPSIGLLVSLAFGFAWLLRARPQGAGQQRIVLVTVGVVAIVAGASIARTRDQLGYWRDTNTLCLRMLEIAPDAAVPHNAYGNELLRQGNIEGAIRHYERALKAQPANENVHYNLANVLARLGRTEDAVEHYRQAVMLRPGLAEAWSNWGATLAQAGRHAEAVTRYAEAIKLRREAWRAHYSMGLSLAAIGKTDDAVRALLDSAAIQPRSETHVLVGDLLRSAGRTQEAAAQYRQALRLNRTDRAARERLQSMPAE